MRSILQNERCCFLCGSTAWLEEHHVYGGARRKISEKHGFKVHLCHYCHNEPPMGVHHNKERRLFLQAKCQEKYEETHSREEFMALIGKNYLD